MIIETFKFIYKDEVIFSCDTKAIDGFDIRYKVTVFTIHEFFIEGIVTNNRMCAGNGFQTTIENCNSPNFFLIPSITSKGLDYKHCKFYINNELVEFNFEDKRQELIELTFKNIADKYTNVIYCNDQLFVFGTSPSKRMLDKHLNISEVYKENTPKEVMEEGTIKSLEHKLKWYRLDIKDVTVKISGLCNYGIVLGYRIFEPFFRFILRYKSMYVFDENTNSYYKIWLDDDTNISKLMFVEKGEVYF